MDKTELRKKMDKLCKGWGESCTGCPSQDLPVCSQEESVLTAKDYEDGIKAFEDYEKDKMGESTTDDLKMPLRATETSAKGSEYDVVSKPEHYTSTSIECIDAMRETQGDEAVKHYCECNAFKYLWRHNSKNGDEDIRKASWYLNKAVEILDGGRHED